MVQKAEWLEKQNEAFYSIDSGKRQNISKERKTTDESIIVRKNEKTEQKVKINISQAHIFLLE